MVFIEPSVELIEEKDPYKKIELAARTCYKSEDKICDGSALKLVKALIKREHYAMLEHQVFIFEVFDNSEDKKYINFLRSNKYLNVTCSFINYYGDYKYRYLVSGNVRAICQRGVNDPIFQVLHDEYPDLCFGLPHDLDNLELPSKEADARFVNLEKEIDTFSYAEIINHVYYTFRIITDRGVTHELVRHRPCSFAQESTRYVNYKNGLSISIPSGFYDKPREAQIIYQKAFECAELFYKTLIEFCDQTPQQARAVLPTALKTEIVLTANLEELAHILNLRYKGLTGEPHPDIKIVAEMIDKLIRDNFYKNSKIKIEDILDYCAEIKKILQKINNEKV